MANSQKRQINTMMRDGKCITVSHRYQQAKIHAGKFLQNVPFGHLPWLPYGRNRMAPVAFAKQMNRFKSEFRKTRGCNTWDLWAKKV